MLFYSPPNNGSNNTGNDRQYNRQLTKFVLLYFHSSYLYLFLGGKTKLFTRQIKSAKKGKIIFESGHQSQNSDSGVK